jgi:GNAT superfamily N-acetyltransferase
MIKFGVERYYQVSEDIKELIKLHYEEIAVNKDVIPLDPDWDRYKALDDSGLIMTVTARDEGKLIGYAIFFVTSHLHYKSTVYANNDLLYLHPDYRKGLVGVRLITISEGFLKQRGVTKIMWHIKFNKDFSRLLHHLGYVDEDIIVGKIIKD